MKNKLIELFIIVIFLSLLLTPTLITTEILNAIKAFVFTLFPSIFPFFLISDLLICYNFPITLNKYLKGITKKIFHVENASSFILIMSMLSGFPSGAKYVRSLLEKQMINEEEANYLITFTHFANPLFVLTITKNIFHETKLSYLILICMYLSNLLLGFIIRPKKIESKQKTMSVQPVSSFSENLSSSIYSSFKLLTIILGSTCFFFIVSGLTVTWLHPNKILSVLINGFFDITKGTGSITNLSVEWSLKGIMVLTFLSFGGLNVNMQVASIISGSKIKYRNFLLGRICQTALSIILFLIATKCIIII